MEAAVQGVEGAVADQSPIVSSSSALPKIVVIDRWRRMTLGHVYDMDLRKNENLIKEVIIQAQGEVRQSEVRIALLLSRFADGS